MRPPHRSWIAGAVACGLAGTVAGAALVRRVISAESAALLLPTKPEAASASLIIFGARAGASGPSPELDARLRHALALHDAGRATHMLISGGIDASVDEVAIMRSWLQERGVRSEAITEARPGDNTRQTMQTVAALHRDLALGPLVAVSTRYHARRILDEARRHGLALTVSGPAVSPETVHAPTHRARVLTEAIATAYYLLPLTATERISSVLGPWRHRGPRMLARVL